MLKIAKITHRKQKARYSARKSVSNVSLVAPVSGHADPSKKSHCHQISRDVDAAVLRTHEHTGNLYSDMDVTDALNVAANVEGNAAIATKVDANLLRRAFAHPDNKFVLQYESYFGC